MHKYAMPFVAAFFSLFDLVGLAANPTADVLMKTVVATYNDMSSYQDRGATVMKMTVGEREVGEATVRFTTKFVRRGGYLFSWKETENFDKKETVASTSCFWSTGEKGWYKEQFYGAKSKTTEMSLSAATTATAGVSDGASYDIFRLLTDDVSGFRYDQLSNLLITGEEAVAGIISYKVTGNYQDGAVVNLWIGKKDHLIHKGAVSDKRHASTFERTDIVIDATIPTSELSECR